MAADTMRAMPRPATMAEFVWWTVWSNVVAEASMQHQPPTVCLSQGQQAADKAIDLLKLAIRRGDRLGPEL